MFMVKVRSAGRAPASGASKGWGQLGVRPLSGDELVTTCDLALIARRTGENSNRVARQCELRRNSKNIS